MAAKLTTVADAVVTLITSTVTGAGGTVARSFDPFFKLDESEALKVTVVPIGTARRRETRKTFALDHTVQLGVQRRLTNSVAEDTVLEFAETLAAYLEDNELPANTGARLLTVEIVTSYDNDHLNQLGLFTSVIAAAYRTMRNG